MEGTVKVDDKISQRIRGWRERVDALKQQDLYFFNQPIDELTGGIRVRIRGREMLMFASYGYLGLLGHPRINAAAKAAIDEYGTGTHGVRLLAGTLKLHSELEDTIARFKHTERAVTFSSG
ncbi:MAG: 8-amino-7-oxononanoate synthase, partial [Anaerolineales bacterium]